MRAWGAGEPGSVPGVERELLYLTIYNHRWGHHEPHSLHGEAEAQAVYEAGLRSKGKERAEPDSADSR